MLYEVITRLGGAEADNDAADEPGTGGGGDGVDVRCQCDWIAVAAQHRPQVVHRDEHFDALIGVSDTRMHHAHMLP